MLWESPHDTFERRRDEAVRNKGTIMPGLNDANVNVVDIPRHNYKGTIKEATREAIAQCKKIFVPNGKPRILKYNNGSKFDFTISGNAIEESLNPKLSAKIANKGVQLALAAHLDKVIQASIEVEEHPDYISRDEQGNRTIEKVSDIALMHRFYGVIHCDGKIIAS